MSFKGTSMSYQPNLIFFPFETGNIMVIFCILITADLLMMMDWSLIIWFLISSP